MNMKNYIRIVGSTLAVGALLAVVAFAEDKSDSAKTDPKMEEMMKKMEAAGKPGAEHKALEPLVGEWNAEVKCWMAPEGQPTVTKATAKTTWVMDGRFIQEEFNGEFMGKPFRGLSITGYDNTKQEYKNVWLDDMHTGLFTSAGKAQPSATGRGEAEGQVITLEGKYDCPMTGRKDVTMKQVLRIINKDKHIFEMHDPSLTGNTKTMEITYTRK